MNLPEGAGCDEVPVLSHYETWLGSQRGGIFIEDLQS